MEADEFVGGDGLRFVASRLQRGKMKVFRDYEIGLRRNRAAAEFVVVWIGHDQAEAVMGFNLADVAVQLSQQFQQRRHIAPTCGAGERTVISSYSNRISVETASMIQPSRRARRMR
jgi:hypothetical protein